MIHFLFYIKQFSILLISVYSFTSSIYSSKMLWSTESVDFSIYQFYVHSLLQFVIANSLKYIITIYINITIIIVIRKNVKTFVLSF